MIVFIRSDDGSSVLCQLGANRPFIEPLFSGPGITLFLKNAFQSANPPRRDSMFGVRGFWCRHKLWRKSNGLVRPHPGGIAEVSHKDFLLQVTPRKYQKIWHSRCCCCCLGFPSKTCRSYFVVDVETTSLWEERAVGRKHTQRVDSNQKKWK